MNKFAYSKLMDLSTESNKAKDKVVERSYRSAGQIFSNIGLTTALAALLARKKLKLRNFGKNQATFMGGLTGLIGSSFLQALSGQFGRVAPPHSQSSFKKYLKDDSPSSYLIPGKAGFQQGRFANQLETMARTNPLKLLSWLSKD